MLGLGIGATGKMQGGTVRGAGGGTGVPHQGIGRFFQRPEWKWTHGRDLLRMQAGGKRGRRMAGKEAAEWRGK